MRVLVACERSGIVRDAFLALGHDAYSCDIELSEVGGPHLMADASLHLDDGNHWDLLIAHPPCRYLSVSGMHWTVRGLRDPNETVKAIAFAEFLWGSKVPRICIENPVGVLSTRSKLGKTPYSVQPWQFGHDASKKTMLWLKGLPALVPSGPFIEPRIVEWPKGSGKLCKRWGNQTDSGQNKLGPSDTRSMDRARTYQGIAKAMAEQWGKL